MLTLNLTIVGDSIGESDTSFINYILRERFRHIDWGDMRYPPVANYLGSITCKIYLPVEFWESYIFSQLVEPYQWTSLNSDLGSIRSGGEWAIVVLPIQYASSASGLSQRCNQPPVLHRLSCQHRLALRKLNLSRVAF
jgi:hypothetical protein